MNKGRQILDKKVLLYILAFVLIAFVLSASSAILAKMGGRYQSYSWEALIANVAFRYISKFGYILLAIAGIRYARVRFGLPNFLVICLHIILGTGLTFFSVASQIVFGNLIYGFNDPLTWQYVTEGALMGTDYNFFLYFCILVLVYAYYYFKKQQSYQEQEAKLRAQLLDIKIQTLTAQIQPHFLFNTLNDISALIDIDPERAQNAISDLSELLRQSLQGSEQRLIALEEERNMLDKYVSILNMRFQEKVEIDIHQQTEIEQVQVPPLILQPIVENAVKHGFSMTHDQLKIAVHIRADEKRVNYRLTNNGQPFKKTKDGGLGLRNIQNRLETLFGDDQGCSIENKDGLVVVNVHFPRIS